MEIGWKLKKLYYYLENIFTKRVYLIGQDQFGLIGYSNKLIDKCFGWSKIIVCLVDNNVKNFYKPLRPFQKLSFNKYYYPWFFFNKLIDTIIIYKEKGNEDVSIGYVISYSSNSIVDIKYGNKIKVIDQPVVNICFMCHNLLNDIIGDAATISTKDIIILGYFKTNK